MYAQKSCWYKLPEATKEFDTFYIYSTMYWGANEGDPDSNAKAVPNEMTDLVGPQCYHQDDYSIFYNNIKDNVAKRIAAYKAN